MLEKMFAPNSVAVIGASRTAGKVGYSVLNNLINDFKGTIVPINPAGGELLGLPCYPTILDIPSNIKIDLAVIVVPARFVPDTIDQCGQAGVDNIIVISAGFKESGIEGAKLERACTKNAHKYGMRMLGPNCLGIIDTASNLNASFAASMAHKGNIALISQSGAICTATLDWADANGVGFSKFVSLGNKADISENDLLLEFAKDESTAVIAAYLEGIKNGPEFMEIARRVSKVKPVIIVKSGRSAVGSRAVSSHTGTLAGSDDAYNAAFRQSGVIRADSIEEMLDYSRAFSSQPIPAGTNMAILTNAGGFGIITADACSAKGMSLASFTETTIERLRNRLSPAANFYNPVDILGDASAELYEYALDVILDDPNVDGVILLTSPQAMTDIEKIALVVAERSKSSEISKSTKPILCSFVGGTRIAEGEKVLNYNNIPNYPFPERAVSSMHALCTYSAIRQQTYEPQPVADAARKKAREMGASIIENACRDKRRILGLESLDILKAYNIPIIETANTDTLSETIDACERIGYPIVMKILSPDISHKSDVGGIRLNLNNAGDVERAYHTMMSDIRRYLPDAAIEGVQVQKMMTGGKEIIIGMVRDVQFGPLLMFGLGGTYVEFLKDVSFAVAPINAEEAKHMVTSIKTYPLLAGVRGEAPSDINSIIDSIVKISQMVLDFPQILEFEINPLMVLSDGEGCLAMDIRMTLGEECE